MKYYKLTDYQNSGSVVRTEGRNQQRYFSERGWVESGVMMKYFNTDSPYYGAYEIIFEDEALKLTNGVKNKCVNQSDKYA